MGRGLYRHLKDMSIGSMGVQEGQEGDLRTVCEGERGYRARKDMKIQRVLETMISAVCTCRAQHGSRGSGQVTLESLRALFKSIKSRTKNKNNFLMAKCQTAVTRTHSHRFEWRAS